MLRKAIFTALALIFALSLSAPTAAAEKDYTPARPSINGALSVSEGRLTDAAGAAVQLRGVSTHGLAWYPRFVNEELFRELSADWGCNLIRLAMYSETYCAGDGENSRALVEKGIEYAVAADMYVIVDWHILSDSDPNMHSDEAAEFFRIISAKYSDCENLIFEICNEPNGSTSWEDILRYAEKVVPVIRENCPESPIIIGTPGYSQQLGGAIKNPAPYENVLYALHFYAATHHDYLLNELKRAVEAGLPVFISECGVSEASGDGEIDLDWAEKWFGYIDEKGISFSVWNLSDKAESCALLVKGVNPGVPLSDADLTPGGVFIRDMIRSGGVPEPVMGEVAALPEVVPTPVLPLPGEAVEIVPVPPVPVPVPPVTPDKTPQKDAPVLDASAYIAVGVLVLFAAAAVIAVVFSRRWKKRSIK